MEPNKKKMRMTLRSDSKNLATKPLLQPPCFKLSKLPLLAQIEVIRMMTRPEQYLLSKCSKRTCQVVIFSMPTNNNHEIWVKFSRDTDFRSRVIVQFYLKIAESMVLIHTAKGQFSPEDHRSICDLFRAPPEIYAIWEDSKSLSENFLTTNVVKKSNLLKYKRSRRCWETLSELHPNQDLVLFNGEVIKALIGGYSLFGARNLMISSTKHFCPWPILASFHGEHLLMEDVPIDTFNIHIFVDRWMRKENDKLKSVIFQLGPISFVGTLDYEKFSGMDRKFQYDSLIKDYHKFPNGLFDFSEGYEIRRKTDGKVATIKITEEFSCNYQLHITMEPSRKKMRMTLKSWLKIPAPKPLAQPPRFKLRKLPLLAQIEVIKMMTAPEQYLLSKCSKRTCQTVKNSLPKINNHEIWVKFGCDPVIRIRGIVQFYLKSAETIVLIHEYPEDFFPEEHNYICSLFRAPTEVYAIWEDSESLSENFSTTNVVKRTNLLKYMYCNSLNEFFDLHPNQDLVLFNGEFTQSLGSGHSFFGARNLMLSSTKNYCPYPILSSFRGEHLLMEDVPIHTFYIQAFVDKWIKKKNDKLKSAIFQLEPRSVVGTLKYNKFSGMDKKFQYDSLIEDYHKFPNGLFDCTEGYEIRRETDGKVATIKITGEYLLFLVW